MKKTKQKIKVWVHDTSTSKHYMKPVMVDMPKTKKQHADFFEKYGHRPFLEVGAYNAPKQINKYERSLFFKKGTKWVDKKGRTVKQYLADGKKKENQCIVSEDNCAKVVDYATKNHEIFLYGTGHNSADMLPETPNKLHANRKIFNKQIQLFIQNPTDKEQTINLFNNEGDFINNISNSLALTDYAQVKNMLGTKGHDIDCMLLSTYAPAYRDLKIEVSQTNVFNQGNKISFYGVEYMDMYAVQSSNLVIPCNFNLNSGTQVSVTLKPNQSLFITFFAKNDVVKTLENIKHPFAKLLLQKYIDLGGQTWHKIMQGQKLNISAAALKAIGGSPADFQGSVYHNPHMSPIMHNTSTIYGSSTSKTSISQTQLTHITNAILKINDIPADLYRNMVNLYLKMDKYYNSNSYALSA